MMDYEIEHQEEDVGDQEMEEEEEEVDGGEYIEVENNGMDMDDVPVTQEDAWAVIR
jgi:hypothetical protein